ncbi:MAG: cell wall-binding repeat-containing protein [Actinomycetota bacterium]|nr:cell wall-binding repeat-containing protein [Actinomycetota bacterium]
MTGKKSQLILIAAAVAVLMVFAAAAAAGAASSSPMIDKTESGDTYAEAAVVIGSPGATPVVYVATGLNFPDALGAGPVAGIGDAPILLVQQHTIPAATRNELTRLHPDKIVIVGGPAVISATVEAELQFYATMVERLAGANRYETAAEISKARFPAPHVFMVYDTSGASTTIKTTCTSYENLVVPITVPGPGTIIVEANVNVKVEHTAGVHGLFDLLIGTSPTDCDSNMGPGAGGDNVFIFMDRQPNGDYYSWLTMKKVMHVSTPGTTTFYVTGKEIVGTSDIGTFWYAYMDATFIPDPGT